MAYRRCDCKIGDIPHPTKAQHKRPFSRCTRAVTMEIRRVRDTEGRSTKGPWYAFCDPCGKAIVAYQTTDVEERPAPESRQPGPVEQMTNSGEIGTGPYHGERR